MKLIILFLLLPMFSLSQNIGDTDTSKCFIKVYYIKTDQCKYIQGYEVEKCTKVIYKNGKPWDWQWIRLRYLDADKKRIDPKGKVIIYIESRM